MTNELEARIRLWLKTLQKNLYQPMEEIRLEAFYTDKQLSQEQVTGEKFVSVKAGDHWGREWEYGWFHASVCLKEWAVGKRIVMDLNMGGEATLYINGEPFGTRRDDWIVQEHHFICDNYLTRKAEGKEIYELMAECYAGHSRPAEEGECISGAYFLNQKWTKPDPEIFRRSIGISTVGIWREEAYHLYLEASALYEIWNNEPADSLRRSELEEVLKLFCLTLDFEQSEDAFELSLHETRKLLRPYLLCKNGTTTPIFHMIGHAHIDLSWLWPIEETMRKCARTMAAQIRHMEEYPNYKMIISQPWLMEQIEILYPSLFIKMKEKIKEGQLIPEGGMWVEADTNLPSGESLIRQFYYGKKYLKEKFDVNSTLLWLPDVFGYSGNMPQIMRGCGITHFTTHKIFWTYNGGEPFPYQYFNWRGIDGTAIPSFIHVEYSSSTNADTLIKRWQGRAQKTSLRRLLQPFGYGDGGGGPTRDHIENCILMGDIEGVPKTVFDDPMHFFDCIKEDGYAENEYVGELYYQAHRGTYTTQSKTKQGNRKGEAAIREAEFICTAAVVSGGGTYPYDKLEAAWKLLLFQQFHDILPGSSIKRVYERAEQSYIQIQKLCDQIQKEAAKSLINKKHGVITCFNSLSWDRQTVIKLAGKWEAAEDAHGKDVILQHRGEYTYALVEIPACGTAVLYEKEKKHADWESKKNSTKAYWEKEGEMAVLSNDKLKVRIDNRGRLISITDKEKEKEWTGDPCNEIKMYQDIPGHFEAWDLDSLYRDKEIPLSENGKIEIEETGPIIAVVKVKRRIGTSELVQKFSIELHNPVIRIHTCLNWQENHKVLKAVFPTVIDTQELCSEIQYGILKRPNHKSTQFDKDRFEVCNHRWSALMEGGKGAAVLNDSKYGVSSKGSSIELTLVKASGFPDEEADRGMQEFTYGFTFWNGSFVNSSMIRDAYEMNHQITIMQGEALLGSFIQLSDHNIIADTIKRAESGTGTVIRLYESKGASTDLRIRIGFDCFKAYSTDMLENIKEEVLVSNNEIYLSFRPYEVKTLLLYDQSN